MVQKTTKLMNDLVHEYDDLRGRLIGHGPLNEADANSLYQALILAADALDHLQWVLNRIEYDR